MVKTLFRILISEICIDVRSGKRYVHEENIVESLSDKQK